MYKQVYDAKGNHTGTFDGEYVYDLSGKILYRVDNDEVYNTYPVSISAAMKMVKRPKLMVQAFFA